MIETVVASQNNHFSLQSDEARREIGQYFTGSAIAGYMATMLKPVKAETIRVLDAGAGGGILTVAVALHYLDMGNKHIHAVLYEIDKSVLSCLRKTMCQVAGLFRKKGGVFTFDIHHSDFVLARPDRRSKDFHVSLINPPYFKYNSQTSPYADATADLFKGNPNIYASFMAIVMSCLAEGGQMVAIVPRSFANGLYFRGFRQFMASVASLEKIHIFRARNKVFREQAVLQENIICHYRRDCQRINIEISTSDGHDDLQQSTLDKYSAELLLNKDRGHNIIRIPESAEDAYIMGVVESWHSSFQKNAYFISTGPVVEFRARKFISLSNTGDNNVPLFKTHNIKPFRSVWTGEHKKDICFQLSVGHEKYTSPNRFYVILKRFTSKDEKRRLVAAVHDPATVSNELIALENHINYIGCKDGEFNSEEAYGLAVLLNSTLLDRYFRCISGNTQVNATEIRMLQLPTRSIICQMGADYQKVRAKSKYTGQQHIDDLVASYCM